MGGAGGWGCERVACLRPASKPMPEARSHLGISDSQLSLLYSMLHYSQAMEWSNKNLLETDVMILFALKIIGCMVLLQQLRLVLLSVDKKMVIFCHYFDVWKGSRIRIFRVRGRAQRSYSSDADFSWAFEKWYSTKAASSAFQSTMVVSIVFFHAF